MPVVGDPEGDSLVVALAELGQQVRISLGSPLARASAVA
jgi:hypothetical protein